MTEEKYDPCIEFFISSCIRLETSVRMYCATGFSDREICSVLSKILKETMNRQEDPKGALDQLIHFLRKEE